MKPWEQEWGQFSFDARIVSRASDGFVVADPRGDSHAETVELARFISAAPDMARALLADMVRGEDGLMHDEFRCPSLSGGQCAEWCRGKRDALRKAGVLT